MKLKESPYGVETPGGIIGLQEAPIRIVAPFVKTYGPAASRFLRTFTPMELDQWQDGILRDTLGVRANGKWSAPDVGLVISRQNGKSELAAARIIIGLYVLKEPLILYSAHRSDTAAQIFKRVQDIIADSPELLKITRHVRKSSGEIIVGRQTNGQESITVFDPVTKRNVSTAQFRTRVKNAGRGFTADCLILDEAMDLDSGFIGDVYPTLSARPNAQAIMMGSAGTKDSEAFGADRLRAMSDDPGLITWLEWSAELCNERCDSDCEEHDKPFAPETYAKTNPAYGIRISHEAVEKDRRKLSYDEFAIERLSVGDWPVENNEFSVIDKESWERQYDKSGERPVGTVVFAVATSIDNEFSCITVAGYMDYSREKIKVQVTEAEYVDFRPGTQWLVPRIVELCARWKPYAVVIDDHSQAGELIPELVDDYGINVVSPKSIEYAQACAKVTEGIKGKKDQEPWLFHSGQAELTNAVANVDKRKLSGLWAWVQANESIQIVALESATLAVWGLRTQSRDNPTKDVFVL